jgi:hypothetical protein
MQAKTNQDLTLYWPVTLNSLALMIKLHQSGTLADFKKQVS